MNALGEIIRDEIGRHGPMMFARFMELALYHPELGYYEARTQQIGRRGDYFTSVSVGPVFGEMIAFQIADWLEGLRSVRSPKFEVRSQKSPSICPSSDLFQIVEAGAHNGQLAADILGLLRANNQKVFENLEYWILEPSDRRRSVQQENLGSFREKIRWFSEWNEASHSKRQLAMDTRKCPSICGVVLSNELLDAMPVHRLGWDANNKEWFEWGVVNESDRFVWARVPLRSKTFPELERIPDELLGVLPDAWTFEVCPRAVEWWRSAARSLEKGWLIAFDYGFTTGECFRPERVGGTVRAFRGHQFCEDPLSVPGDQDITAHVNFTALEAAGEQEGLRTEGLFSQADFLVGILKRLEQRSNTGDFWSRERRRQFQTLTHPDHLGRAFRVLVQSRGN